MVNKPDRTKRASIEQKSKELSQAPAIWYIETAAFQVAINRFQPAKTCFLISGALEFLFFPLCFYLFVQDNSALTNKMNKIANFIKTPMKKCTAWRNINIYSFSCKSAQK
jgi:hypothetical protein